MKIKILPAYNGDCILISFDDQLITRNILIDGGIPKTYLRHLKPELEKLLSLGQVVDLLIVTHIDDDHIGGIKEIFQESKLNRSFIKSVWFNSGNLLSDYFNAKREEKEREVSLLMDDQTQMSVKQGVTLEKALEEHKGWAQTLIKYTGSQINFLGVSITILSPNDQKLELLHKRWETETETKVKMSEEHNDFNISIAELIDRKFTEDQSVPNGSSIALLIEKEEKKLLLLGDAHPSVVAASLITSGLATHEKRLKVDLVKISHHASKGNTSNELLDLIDCKHFAISTDGSKHGLPDKEALARIVARFPKCNLYFNYEGLGQQIFSTQDTEQYTFSYHELAHSNFNYLINF